MYSYVYFFFGKSEWDLVYVSYYDKILKIEYFINRIYFSYFWRFKFYIKKISRFVVR